MKTPTRSEKKKMQIKEKAAALHKVSHEPGTFCLCFTG